MASSADTSTKKRMSVDLYATDYLSGKRRTQSCMIWSSRKICFRTDGFASMWTTCAIVGVAEAGSVCNQHCSGIGAGRPELEFAPARTHLPCHQSACRDVPDAAHGPAVPVPNLLYDL